MQRGSRPTSTISAGGISPPRQRCAALYRFASAGQCMENCVCVCDIQGPPICAGGFVGLQFWQPGLGPPWLETAPSPGSEHIRETDEHHGREAEAHAR
mmetsp:Transcript_83920/g.115890  ORF Transcript_83920/g.115890 Transcript_83920/m.115890 type:complete len:98 (+) Transcript_83920:389-682(+)